MLGESSEVCLDNLTLPRLVITLFYLFMHFWRMIRWASSPISLVLPASEGSVRQGSQIVGLYNIVLTSLIFLNSVYFLKIEQ